MPKAPFIDSLGRKGQDVDLPTEIFDVQVNVPVLNEVIRGQLAAARAGTHSTKTRAEVRGGGRKPWRQKGTGRARHGSIREPQWIGGGVAHGPKPRDYAMRINKKERQVALRSALTDRAREGKLMVIELPEFEEPETAKAVQLLKEWEVTGKTLLVVSAADQEAQDKAWLSFRNLPDVLTVTYPTAYTVLAADTVIFTRTALDELTTAAAARSKKGVTGSSATSATARGSGSSSAREETRKAPDSVPQASSPSVAPDGPDAAESPPRTTKTSPTSVTDGPDAAEPSEPATTAEGTADSGPGQATDTANSGGTGLRAALTPESTRIEPEHAPEPEGAGTAPPEPESEPGTDRGGRE